MLLKFHVAFLCPYFLVKYLLQIGDLTFHNWKKGRSWIGGNERWEVEVWTLGSNSPLSWEGFSMSNLDHSCRWRRWGGAPGWPTDPPAPGSLSMSLQTPSGLRWVDPSAILLTIIKKKYGSLINSAVCYDCCKRWKLRRSLDCGCSSLTFNCQKHQKIVRNKYIALAIYWS